jgi:uncharacterized protein YjiS (DUF1127 family)
MLTLQSLWTTLSASPNSSSEAATPIAWLRLPALWRRRLHDRHALSLLDSTQLRDAGLNPEMIRRETAKRFWQD